ncbi:MAG: carbohydrate binding family 9 domain-containing protein [Candidatus Aminicenantes bacterium]|nr:carbohydrate binding family 9 domain-containing protein [Candidatus Aminicenantes bacterium]
MTKKLLFLIVLTLFLYSSAAWPVEYQADGKIIIPDKVTGEITIDGKLHEAVWQIPPLDKEFMSLIPNYGNPLGLKTLVWAAYDKGSIYFAFKCFDPESKKIKSSIAQRDKIFNDDVFGVLLDASGNKQGSYEFYTNPRGIQMDSLNSAVSGVDFEPDFVWESAGRMIPEGYQGEIRIPLESIRYQRGKNKEVKMRVMFYRGVPHRGVVATWPGIETGQTEYNFMASLLYHDLKNTLKLEVLPNITYSRNSDRVNPDTWDTTTDTNVGVGIKYGITSSITAEGTVNPDYSQVESDAFQVEVNRRYPIFFSEKRPFFMESKEVLDFTLIHQSMMIDPIHTRSIIDPGWALKLSGSAGKMNFAMLTANDRSAGRPWDTGVNPNEGKNALFGLFRAKYNIGSDNSLGVLYSGRRFGDQQNDVVGADIKYRLSKEIRASLSYLHTSTQNAENEPVAKGSGLNAMLQYNSPKLISWAIYERYDPDFYMSTAFLLRSSISRAAFGIGPVFNVNTKGLPWLKRIIPFTHYYKVHDLGTKMTDTSWELGVNLALAPLGELYLEYWDESEAWAGQLLDKNYFHSIGYIQLFKWLHIFEDITIGDQVFYHPTTPFVGNGKLMQISITLEPGANIKLGLDYLYSNLKTKEDKQEVYSGSIYNLHTTYQFNRYFFIRGILRYDGFQDKMLTDFLASFTLIPGTVVHLGYGSLYHKNQWQGNRWIPGQGDFMEMKRGLFFKASYLWRIK